MLGVGRGITTALVGWLWADLLLGMFVIFLAAAAGGAPVPAVAAGPTVEAEAVPITVTIDGPLLLTGKGAEVAAEQQRIADEVKRQIATKHPTGRVAFALAFATHQVPAAGDRLAKLATEALQTGAFDRATMKTYHDLVAGDPGTTLSLELYFFTGSGP